MRFLFLTIQGFESDFYGRAGRGLTALGHEVEHVTLSRRAAARHRAAGLSSRSLNDLIAQLPLRALDDEVARIEAEYALPSIRELYWTDPAYADRSESWCMRRTVDVVRALERVFDELQPHIVIPEVGRETPRVVAHQIALRRGIRTFFLFYTIFPRPLRLYIDTMDAPIVSAEELRELTPDEQRELDAFRRSFVERNAPIRPHRQRAITTFRARRFAAYLATLWGEHGENEYLRPLRWALEYPRDALRAQLARGLYRKLDPDRPFVYFPLHVTDDYKIKRVIPHCADQASLVEQIADALPPGYDLVLKEHPGSIGGNSLSLLRRFQRRKNVRLVDPRTSTHELIRRSEAVTVISSTVGVEALLHAKPVLTLGRPFYSGLGVTLDLNSSGEIRTGTPDLLSFRPDPAVMDRFLHAAMRACYPGVPVLVDDSDENAATLAASLESAVTRLAVERGRSVEVHARRPLG